MVSRALIDVKYHVMVDHLSPALLLPGQKIYIIALSVPESNGGQYLIRLGEINVGSHINAMFRLRCRSSAPLGAPHEMQVLMQEKRHATYFGRS